MPEHASSAGDEAIELAAMAGLVLDPWQQLILQAGMSENAAGRWAAFEVAMVVPRQNGKGGVLEARELAGLFLLGERLIVHSAHQADTSFEHFRRLRALIEDTPELERRVHKIHESHGAEGIELLNGQRIRFRTRTKGGGRGFSGDLLVLDEAMILQEAAHASLIPTLSARPEVQVWYAASAVDQTVHDNGRVLARLRARAIAGEDPRLVFFEYGLELPEREDGGPVTPDDVDQMTAADPDSWAQANPGLGIRITPEFVAAERRALDARSFAVERLGVGDWPQPDGRGPVMISKERWAELEDERSSVRDPVAFAFDVTPDRGWCSIGVAGLRRDKIAHVEMVARGRGTAWVAERVKELVDRHKSTGVFCDGAGPAASLVPDLERLGVDVTPLTAAEHARGCGALFDAVTEGTIRHLGQPELAAAVDGSTQRPLGDAWAWSRKTSSTDISPLVSVTLAFWGFANRPRKKRPAVLYS